MSQIYQERSRNSGQEEYKPITHVFAYKTGTFDNLYEPDIR